MNASTTLEIHLHGQWQKAATLTALDGDSCLFNYETRYVFGAAQPLSLAVPVAFVDSAYIGSMDGGFQARRPELPAFLYDLVPQGRGRALLTRLLGLPDRDGIELPLIMAGAFNPIGRLRVTSAVAFYEDYKTRHGARHGREWAGGVTIDDIVTHAEGFLEQLALHEMLASGTTGVQGVAPKFLLATDAQGRWHPDLALDDASAVAHWLIKLPRGRSDDDRLVLTNEAAYLRVAQRCGVRVHEEPRLHGEMLFVRRFDRVKDANGTLHRLHQESLASLAGLRGFAPATTHNQLLAALRAHVTHPLAETIEYLKRDALNLALRNTDNHARNTAVQQLLDGTVQLTPLFDFAPSYKDPELIPRAVHWCDADGLRLHHWPQIVASLNLDEPEDAQVRTAMRAFASVLEQLPAFCVDAGVDALILRECLGAIERTARELHEL